MSTLKAINLQHPSSGNPNMTLTSNGTVSLDTVPIMEMGQTISGNVTINTGKNAFTAGPVQIANAVFVTIPDGSYWSVT